MSITVIKGELEIDDERGVIYFHPYDGPLKGTTQLRICGLAKPPCDKFIDITLIPHTMAYKVGYTE